MPSGTAGESPAATGRRALGAENRCRGFLEAERARGRVMVVNETLARLAWPDRPAVGECVYVEHEHEACTTVVGVVADTRRFVLVEEEPFPYFYEVLSSDDTRPRELLVRTAPNPRPTPIRTNPIAAAATWPRVSPVFSSHRRPRPVGCVGMAPARG